MLTADNSAWQPAHGAQPPCGRFTRRVRLCTTPQHSHNGILRQLGAEGYFYRGDAKRRLHREIEVLQSIQHVRPVVIVDKA